MPAILLERLPLPSLHTYISFSVLILALAAFYAHQTVRAKLDFDPDTQNLDDLSLPPELVNVTLPYGNDEHFMNMIHVMTVETWCIWTLVNSCYCLLILLGKLIQSIVFGELRVSEQQHIKDKFWNFVFYKFIFVFGVMNVQSLEQVVLWVAWFSCLGFFHLLTQLCKDRFEYLSFSPATPWSAHVKLLCLLLVILLSCGLLLAVCVWVALNLNLTLFFFLAAESTLLLLNCLYVVVRYVIHLWEMSLEGVWESRAVYVYYTELVFELVAHCIDFAHHLHMLLHGNIFLSMASLVICMQLRHLFYEFQRRIKRHKNYLRVVKDMEAKFPMATQEDLEQNADDCAICWERMEVARKLPCGHLFHNSCLRSWLEQDTSCPTCRTTLSDGPSDPEGTRTPVEIPPNAIEGIVPPPNQGTTNHFFHFDGSRYVSWLPSFSLEVTHTNLLPGQQQQAHATQTSQLDNMAREVQVVFPNIPQTVILEDLRVTRSVDLTIDNILEGRVTAPPVSHSHQINESYSSAPSTSVEGSTTHPSNDSYSAISSTSVEAPSMPGSEALQVATEPPVTSSHVRDVSHPLPNLQQSLSTLSQPSSQSTEHGASSNPLGGRFSKSASERMSMLSQRKQTMLEHAQRQYLAKLEKQESFKLPGEDDSPLSSSELSSSSLSSSSLSLPPDPPAQQSSSVDLLLTDTSSEGPSEQARRRAILLEATQRRLERGSSPD